MEQKADGIPFSTKQLEMHLKSAVDTLTPDIYHKIDLSLPQEAVLRQESGQAVLLRLRRRMRVFAAAAAACVCITFIGGGAFQYHLANRRVESIIGIDVNPSVELSINRKERVLEARGLNEDARAIMEDMDLKGVDLNVAVNAVVGSMVTHGYLDNLDNAILVTVSNDSVRKARELRTSVVGDIEQTLKENQVEAVVYDQQVIEDEQMKELAAEYDISYGKAYFLKELIDQNKGLSMEDMKELSSLTMEEIVRKIAEDSYILGELADRATETTAQETLPPTETEPFTDTQPVSQENTQPETTADTLPETTTETAVREPETTVPAETEEESQDEQIEIDYVDYDDGLVYVYFAGSVNWKKPSVIVRDDDGNSYAAMIVDTSRKDCVFEVGGLEGGKSYTFVLGGLALSGSSENVTVRGFFEKPEIAEELEGDTSADPDEDEEETAASSGTEDKEQESEKSQESGEGMTETQKGQEAKPTEELSQETKPQDGTKLQEQ